MDPIYEFLTMGISSIELRRLILTDDALLARIQERIPQSKFAHDPEWNDSPMSGEAFSYDDFDLRRTLSTGYYGLGKLYGASVAYDLIYDLFCEEYPGIERRDDYHRLFDLALDAVPDCVQSTEASEVIFSVILETEGLPEKERKKRIRERVRELFYLNESKKRPRWIQESDWPVAYGRPMRFVSQKSDGEIARYTFEDVETKERRVIEQFY